MLAAGVVMMVVGYVGLFFGRLIKASVSRSREYLADASAVQFTRQTSGIAGALKRSRGCRPAPALAMPIPRKSAMLFGEGMGFSSLFATHPPILQRIKALEPDFDAKAFEQVRARWAVQPPSGTQEDLALGFAPDGSRLGTGQALPAARAELEVGPQQVVAQVGTPAADDYQRASAIVQALSDDLRELARRHDRAVPLILALLLDADAALRGRQLDKSHRSLMNPRDAGARYGTVAQLHRCAPPAGPFAFPVLRRRPRPELAATALRVLIGLDGKVAMSEYLGRLLRGRRLRRWIPRFAQQTAQLVQVGPGGGSAGGLYGHEIRSWRSMPTPPA